MKKLALVVSLMVVMTGCATQPIGPQTRAGWQALHVHVLHGVTQTQALDAAQHVLQLADHDFKFDFPPRQLIAKRSWSIYMVLAATMGTDYWRITTTPVTDGVSMMVQISRQAGSITPSPVVGANGVIGASAGAMSLPGQSIRGPFPYHLFWSRLDYMLGLGSTWATCDMAKAGKTHRQKINSDTLCSVTTDDHAPAHPMDAAVAQGSH